MIESGSDKYSTHHYERYYRRWLEPFRHKDNLKFVEIGAEQGRSINLWDNYFTKAELIMGLAYDNTQGRTISRLNQPISGTTQRVHIMYGDQSKKETMDRIKAMGPFDIIVDDGSHIPEHVVFSFFSLWSSVKEGGLYVIEDLETSYWKPNTGLYGYTVGLTGISASPKYNVVTKLMQLVHLLSRRQLHGWEEFSVMPDNGDADICSIEFGMNLLVVRKCELRDGALSYQDLQPRKGKLYDVKELEQWIQEAKSTNPVID